MPERSADHPLSRLRRAIQLIQNNPFKSSYLSEAEQLLLGVEREALDGEHEPAPRKPTMEEWVRGGYNPAQYEDAMVRLDEAAREHARAPARLPR
jgi:hypothetical protein